MSCEKNAIIKGILKQMSAMNNQIERIISWMEAVAPQLKPGDKGPVVKTKSKPKPLVLKQGKKDILPGRKKPLQRVRPMQRQRKQATGNKDRHQ